MLRRKEIKMKNLKGMGGEKKEAPSLNFQKDMRDSKIIGLKLYCTQLHSKWEETGK